MGKVKKIIPIIIALFLVPVGIYTISPFFINTTVDEAIPLATAGNEIVSVFSGTFVGVGDGVHDVQGIANVIEAEDVQYLRFENFAAANGPDLYVYLSTDENASEFISLGKLKANNGNQNYEIPEGTDLDKYSKVLVWCQMFSVLFGSAELQ